MSCAHPEQLGARVARSSDSVEWQCLTLAPILLCLPCPGPCSRLQQLPPGHVPLKVRVTKLGEMVAHGTKVTVVFLATAPGK